MKTIKERDMELERLWEELEDVPMDPETECIEESFHIWPAGTDREKIWRWFDNRHSKGVVYLLYGDGIDRTDQIAKLVYLDELCFECESQTCQFNHGGECRFALVHERKPVITEENGCTDDYCRNNPPTPAPMVIPPALGVGTPLGDLVVRTTVGSKRLGYLINLLCPDLNIESPVVRVEVVGDGSDAPNHDKEIQVHVWNNPEKTFLNDEQLF